MVPATCGVNLPSSVTPIYKGPRRHAQSIVSMVITNIIKLTIRINFHRLFGPYGPGKERLQSCRYNAMYPQIQVIEWLWLCPNKTLFETEFCLYLDLRSHFVDPGLCEQYLQHSGKYVVPCKVFMTTDFGWSGLGWGLRFSGATTFPG